MSRPKAIGPRSVVLALSAVVTVRLALRATDERARCCADPPSRRVHARVRAEVDAGDPGLDTEMVLVPGGTFWMGNDDPRAPDARPWHEVTVEAFWLDRTEVTNEQFLRFVEVTGYVTTAERSIDGQAPSGIVFTPPAGHVGTPRDPRARSSGVSATRSCRSAGTTPSPS